MVHNPGGDWHPGGAISKVYLLPGSMTKLKLKLNQSEYATEFMTKCLFLLIRPQKLHLSTLNIIVANQKKACHLPPCTPLCSWGHRPGGVALSIRGGTQGPLCPQTQIYDDLHVLSS